MVNPIIPDSVKYKMFSNVNNYPLLGAKEPLKSIIDPEAVKPPPFITVPPKLPASIIYTTPDDREKLLDLTKLPGFTPDVTWSWEKLTESFPIHEPSWQDLVYYKDYPDSVEKINGRWPINGDLAGQKHPLSGELQTLYPEGVHFKENGVPNFTPYANKIVKLEGLTGEYTEDSKKANKAIGLLDTPQGWTWHHVEDGKTMELIPTKLHKAVPHTGGAALLRSIKGKNK